MKTLEKTMVFFLMLFVTVAFAGQFAAAQEMSPTDMKILTDKLKADKKLLVSENMQLSEAEAQKFWPVYQDFQDELFILRMRSLNLIKAYADKYDSMTDETAKKLLDEYLTIEDLRQKVRQAYLPKFRAVLPEKKVARYYQIENKISAIVNYELAADIPLVNTKK